MWCVYRNLYLMRSMFVGNNPLLCYICMSIGDITYGEMHLLGSRRNKVNLHRNLLGFIEGKGRRGVTEVYKHVTTTLVSVNSSNSQICMNPT